MPRMLFYTFLRCFSIWFTISVYIPSLWPLLSTSTAMKTVLPTAWPRLTSDLAQIRYHSKKKKNHSLSEYTPCYLNFLTLKASSLFEKQYRAVVESTGYGTDFPCPILAMLLTSYNLGQTPPYPKIGIIFAHKSKGSLSANEPEPLALHLRAWPKLRSHHPLELLHLE